LLQPEERPVPEESDCLMPEDVRMNPFDRKALYLSPEALLLPGGVPARAFQALPLKLLPFLCFPAFLRQAELPCRHSGDIRDSCHKGAKL
jgi:hypothetical protein